MLEHLMRPEALENISGSLIIISDEMPARLADGLRCPPIDRMRIAKHTVDSVRPRV
jgi:hypothetical protein